MERMVQRVVRQVQEAQLTNNITLATNESQLDIITYQLGDKVSIVTESVRRDTFPAIALVVSYLSLAKNCLDDKIVVIMPCDTYTEISYFKTIAHMIEYVKQDVAELVLMGITPTYPSEKYGYIVPEVGNQNTAIMSQMVASFIEKPTTSIAEELLKQNAYWNGGVFAFRLGYMMNIVRRYVKSDCFEETRVHYDKFPKISFDYEVVEKAQSVAVVPCKGEWKDLGTWNALTDELKKPILGNVLMGSHCVNTHVINELQYPIYVDGLTNIVVAASPDGILICGKEYSEKIKKAIEYFNYRPMYEEKCWGKYRVLDDSVYSDGNHSLIKVISLNSGKRICYQRHHHRSETCVFTQGEGIFVFGVEQHVKAGDTIFIPTRHYHAIKAITKLTFIEIQCGNPLIEEDMERFEYK